ncbi:hypothetical protein MUN82_10270 [Hymenobacter aerilatus]|uniref:Uncharacterized protein n=1 Tax=Hymenobacter aerilatus TaxID=2932251 RepID=A0A8T9SYY6_9BACT|nr:hypothetical protein [Hymenobacter aerilatus]UOR07462.1 hypothetical protein MUN82_10270 [Hymenobacter aerilatus]
MPYVHSLLPYIPSAMASNLDYLNPDLLPLEEKLNAYLEAEQDYRRAATQATNLPVDHAASSKTDDLFAQRPATGSFDQATDEVTQQLDTMRADIEALRRQIIDLLPVRDEFIKVNLGYGPSRAGAFRIPSSPADAPEYELRIVH